MFRLLRRIALLLIAAIALFLMLPPRARALPSLPAGLAPGVHGALHVHTNRSDGTGSVDDVIRAAAAAGLNFVIVTDHTDGTRAPDLPDYREGVLYIDAAEISTWNGHLLALGMPKTPYPLGGEGRDVVDDIHRLGGLAIAAHPGSGKPELQWTDWNAPIDGLEWLNADSEWRDERPWTMARALIAYPFRPAQSLALLLDRPEPVMRRWDELAQQRRIVGVAGVDAHARVGVRSLGEPYDTAGSLHFPSYTTSFREFSMTANVQLTGDSATDARRVLDAFRDGNVYSTIDALAGPAALRAGVTGGTIIVDAQAPADAQVRLLRDGTVAATGEGPRLERKVEAGVYRVEIALPGAPGTPPVPWIVSNSLYVGRDPDRHVTPDVPPARTFTTLYEGGAARDWTIEKSRESDAAIDVIGALPGSQLLLRYAISGTAADNPYAAFVMPATEALASHERLVFTARADRPMRVSVQLRAPEGAGERWQRSVYLDQTPQTIDLPFRDFRPIGTTNSTLPVLARITSVLFVIDTVNTRVGSNGQIQISGIKYGR